MTAEDFVAPRQNQYSQQSSQTMRTESQRRDAQDWLAEARKEVLELEAVLEITDCWTPANPEYEKAMRAMSMKKYQESIDKLEELVCQWLFELHKLNLSQTGNWMCLGCLITDTQ